MLDLVAIFATLMPDERAAIAAKLKQKSYDQGEMLVEAGTTLHSLFIIGAGVVSFIRDGSEGEIEVERLGPGDHFGEIGMPTGAAGMARITAPTPLTLHELAKEDLSPILEARPPVAQELCRALAQRQALDRLIASPELAETVPMNRLTSWFSDRLHRLYDLASTE